MTWSPEILEVVNAQKALVPGLTNSSIKIECVTVANATVTVDPVSICPPGDYIRVAARVSFALVTPFLPIPNPFTVSSTAHVRIQ